MPLELVFNLEWKVKPTTKLSKHNVVVSMYDLPVTTEYWGQFKSYLLKNAGICDGQGVVISYLDPKLRERIIDGEADYQAAMNLFRNMAEAELIITLYLERRNAPYEHQPTTNKTTQSVAVETEVGEAIKNITADNPPIWFNDYMQGFHISIVQDVTASVLNALENLGISQGGNVHNCSGVPAAACGRKFKAEAVKRRKTPPVPHTSRDVRKCHRLESKLENKLEKLERKTKKIKEKKLALSAMKGSDSDGGAMAAVAEPALGLGLTPQQKAAREEMRKNKAEEDELLQMGARTLVSNNEVPRLNGGEVYLRTWEVVNTGTLPWTTDTTLRFTWGEKAFEPGCRELQVPLLPPGEVGVISVRLQIPTRPGEYECWWNFHHKNRRFGKALSCIVIVEPPNPGWPPYYLSRETLRACQEQTTAAAKHPSVERSSPLDLSPPDLSPPQLTAEPVSYLEAMRAAQEVLNLSFESEVGIRTQPSDENNDRSGYYLSDSDNQSVSSLCTTDSHTSKTGEGFVMVAEENCAEEPKQEVKIENKTEPTPVEPVEEQAEEEEEGLDDNNNTEEVLSVGESSSSVKAEETSGKYDMVVVTLMPGQEDKTLVHIMVDGKPVAVPRKLIKDEYVQNAEKAAASVESTRAPSVASSAEIVNKSEVKDENVLDGAGATAVIPEPLYPDLSHCSAAGSCFSDITSSRGSEIRERLFIFPQDVPGYEVVTPPNEVVKDPYGRGSSDAYGPLDEPKPSAPVATPPPPTTNPFTNTQTELPHVPNYQQTPITSRPIVNEPVARRDSEGSQPTQPKNRPSNEVFYRRESEGGSSVHILPETLVAGAVNVASSAINTARSMINMIKPKDKEPGRWENGIWVCTDSDTVREANLRVLWDMGFYDRNLNATLLARYNDDISQVLNELIQL